MLLFTLKPKEGHELTHVRRLFSLINQPLFMITRLNVDNELLNRCTQYYFYHLNRQMESGSGNATCEGKQMHHYILQLSFIIQSRATLTYFTT